MVVKFVFKRVIPSVLLYYCVIQAYLAYHLYSSQGGAVRAPNLPRIEPDESRQFLVENILSIVQCRATSGNFDTYSDDVEFEDPIMAFEGIANLRNLAFVLTARLKTETLSLKEHHYEDQFIVEVHQKYTTSLGLEFKLPAVLYVELEGKGAHQKVKKIREELYGEALITHDNTPFLFAGLTSRFFRNMHGKVANVIIRSLI